MWMLKSPVFARVWQRFRRTRLRLPSWSIPGEPQSAAGSADRTGTGVAGSAAGLRRRHNRPVGRRAAPGCTASRRRRDAPDNGVTGASVGRGALTRADGIAFRSAGSKPNHRSARSGQWCLGTSRRAHRTGSGGSGGHAAPWVSSLPFAAGNPLACRFA